MSGHACPGGDCARDGREQRMTTVASDNGGRPTIWCDPCIAEIVRALNEGGVRTVASCCGHKRLPGTILLADGRVLVIHGAWGEVATSLPLGRTINDPLAVAAGAPTPREDVVRLARATRALASIVEAEESAERNEGGVENVERADALRALLDEARAALREARL